MHEAMFWEKNQGSRVSCLLCRHRCVISDGKRGVCQVRENRKGVLYSLTYERLAAQHVDPIEKKPMFHFFPGSAAYSIAAPGCNFKCLHCQNADISQVPMNQKVLPGVSVSPQTIVEEAEKNNCASIAYTYTEPTVFYELAYDSARLAHERGIKNIFVTNGYITSEALSEIGPYLDAANIDLKSFNNEFYKKICGAKLAQVLDSIKAYFDLGIWIEITTLVIPNLNDTPEELRQVAEFLASLSREIPWHVSGFYPTHKLLNQPRTSPAALNMAREIGLQAGLKYVYEGNAPGKGGENTYCPNCHKLLIHRMGYAVAEICIKGGVCVYCGAEVAGIGMQRNGANRKTPWNRP